MLNDDKYALIRRIALEMADAREELSRVCKIKIGYYGEVFWYDHVRHVVHNLVYVNAPCT